MSATARLADRAARFVGRHTSRRSFLRRTAIVSTAIAVAPTDFALRPGTAYGAICNCSGSACDCGALCCDGYTEFCCTMTGVNWCPPGTIAAGWWKADGSRYCAGPRYYMDCNNTCRCGGGTICEDACQNAPWGCGCAQGNCNNRKAGCTRFRSGQCNQQVASVGRIACRVVSCDPAVLVLGNCSATLAVDNSTANHNKPCLQAAEVNDVEHGMAVDVTINPTDPTSGYVLDRWGGVHPFGAAVKVRSVAYWPGQDVARRIVITDWTLGQGYVMDLDGGLHRLNRAPRIIGSPYWPGGVIVPFYEV